MIVGGNRSIYSPIDYSKESTDYHYNNDNFAHFYEIKN